MRKLKYHLVDVFTDQPFGGNQLAVFPDGPSIPSELMQRIAKELNFSESTFIFPPKNPKNDAWVRIFTPARELPMAGHPTVGTTFVLVKEKLLKRAGNVTEITLEEGVGDISVSIDWNENKPDLITMTQPHPKFGSIFPDRELIAEMLSIHSSGLHPDYPLEVVSCGLPYLIVPIVNLKTIQSIKLRLDLWKKHLKHYESDHIFVFTTETERKSSTVHCRMFAPSAGVLEDPATGSASGPLGCYLVKHDIVPPAKSERIISEQGFEIGRPSILHIGIGLQNNKITAVRVGGQCVYMGEGYLHL
ncbi:PhzF family phenazine biosynthesis protein [Candidatus Acetothermia bacterium]|nr:PhzF family phenazine biosynthesis protein [Candidatus Acetothermia bacterium]MBI3644128.1 PhzF family phenazine biosynthesis protein [Candidatus Acetothermia bacterium]